MEDETRSNPNLLESEKADNLYGRDNLAKRQREENAQSLQTMNNQIMSHTTQISDIIQGVNKSPRGQNIIIAICVLNMIATGFVGFGVAYYYPTPKFDCRTEGPNGSFSKWFECKDEDMYCANVKINPALGRYGPDELHTWTYTYDLYCDRAN
jgi:hypothetical protein